MIVIAGSLWVDATERTAYLDAVHEVTLWARDAPGCLDFVQAPDPIDAERIVILERWESDGHLAAFRESDGPSPTGAPEVLRADVRKYVISSVEEP